MSVEAPSTLRVPSSLVDAVSAAYRGPGRAYHDVSHLEEVVARFHEVAAGPGWKKPVEVFLALLFHDAVYVPGASDNEARSARLADVALVQHAVDADAEVLRSLILYTASHGRLEGVPLSSDAALFLDCDMAVLGADASRYDAYERAIAAEYAA